MNFKTKQDLEKAGFEGFVKVAKLMDNAKNIPEVKGVYMVVRESSKAPEFLEKGTGGFSKNRNPNVSIVELKENWVEGTCVMYIGKATTLSDRLGQYLSFGQGKPAGHYGGRFIWQLKDAKELLFCWKTLKNTEEPRQTEKELISEFKKQYEGKRPFANLVD